MFVPSFWPNQWVDFSETWHDDRACPNLKHGLKISENGCHGNEKKLKLVILPEKSLGLQI